MIKDLFSIEDENLKKFFDKFIYPEEILPHLHDFILELGPCLDSEYHEIKKDVWVHENASVSNSAEIIGPCIIMEGVKICHNAYLRENVIVGKNSIVGNSSEIKNAILISNVMIPHFNYVGDSILGDKAHLGAGVILANLRLDKENVRVDGRETSLRKIGSFIGDNAQIGSNSVLNPGTIIYPNIMVYPLMNISGVVKENTKKNNVEVRRI